MCVYYSVDDDIFFYRDAVLLFYCTLLMCKFGWLYFLLTEANGKWRLIPGEHIGGLACHHSQNEANYVGVDV